MRLRAVWKPRRGAGTAAAGGAAVTRRGPDRAAVAAALVAIGINPNARQTPLGVTATRKSGSRRRRLPTGGRADGR